MSIQNSVNNVVLSSTALATGGASMRAQKAANALQERREEVYTHKKDTLAFRAFGEFDKDDPNNNGVNPYIKYLGIKGPSTKKDLEEELNKVAYISKERRFEDFVRRRNAYRAANAGANPEDLYVPKYSEGYIKSGNADLDETLKKAFNSPKAKLIEGL